MGQGKSKKKNTGQKTKEKVIVESKNAQENTPIQNRKAETEDESTGKTITASPKVFLPVSYPAFRLS